MERKLFKKKSISEEFKKKLSNVLDFYYSTTKLNYLVRSGWKLYDVKKIRRETDGEHIYSTEMLAWAIYSEFEPDIDINKVISMLSLHEMEEIIIGDYTHLDGISREEKNRIGMKACKKVCKNMQGKKYMIELIEEFNERKTPEAKFAYMCDKLQCDLQAKFYTDAKVTKLEDAEVFNHPKIQECVKKGAKKTSDVFFMCDIDNLKDSPIFTSILLYAKEYMINEKLLNEETLKVK